MKKITLILSVVFLALGVQSFAQEATPRKDDVENVERNDGERKLKKGKKGEKMRAHRAERNRRTPLARRNGKAFRTKKMRRAHRKHLKGMRDVARADGHVSADERRVIKRKHKRFKRGNKRHLRRKDKNRNHRGYHRSEVPRGRS